ncbi:MAG: hypothetical protein A2855_03025 [Candidatus Liptonbacteria bacterium RIFCSPHIGHO2_01_FULL_57_28]|uniref:Uncharacterized protein n=1 Tax=Candidatus Liptonbacteria bacterium RIFCSPHIGHO2_01_FULL_57_28 TaxID=1798647 RepID=A0A1G2C9D6_9BACT|nr:MAG: hypothetical protein A2855_03025 [Candidatus Liptonbacteria bacterium RIFCSPHIGHO2_01_FULL_57_28]
MCEHPLVPASLIAELCDACVVRREEAARQSAKQPQPIGLRPTNGKSRWVPLRSMLLRVDQAGAVRIEAQYCRPIERDPGREDGGEIMIKPEGHDRWVWADCLDPVLFGGASKAHVEARAMGAVTAFFSKRHTHVEVGWA